MLQPVNNITQDVINHLNENVNNFNIFSFKNDQQHQNTTRFKMFGIDVKSIVFNRSAYTLACD